MAATKVREEQLVLRDVTVDNVSTSAHGLVPKAPNTGTQFLRDDATWATPSGGGLTIGQAIMMARTNYQI